MTKYLIPDNLDLDALKKRHPTNYVKGFKEDKVYFICNSIYRNMCYLDDNWKHPDKTKAFMVPLHSKIIEQFGSRAVLYWMIGAGIIECDNHYIPGIVSRGYTFSDEYLSCKSEWVTGTDYVFSKKQIRLKWDEYQTKMAPRTLKKLQSFLMGGKLKIDNETAMQIVLNAKRENIANIQNGNSNKKARKIAREEIRETINKCTISDIQNPKEYMFSQDASGLRFHHPITRLSKTLRETITYDNKNLGEVDISGSQLFFFIYLLDYRNWKYQKNPKKNVFTEEIWKDVRLAERNKRIQYNSTIMFLKNLEKQYGKGVHKSRFVKDAMAGNVYEVIANDVKVKSLRIKMESFDDMRTWVKKCLLMQLFASKHDPNHKFLYENNNTREVWKSFQRFYPEIAQLFEMIKAVDYKDFSKLLQRIESTTVIGHVAKKILEKHNCLLITLHDCLITEEENLQLVYSYMKSEICNVVGYPPTLKFKIWRKDEREDDISIAA